MSDLAPYLRHLTDCTAWAPVSVALASPATEDRPCTCGLRSTLADIGAREEWQEPSPFQGVFTRQARRFLSMPESCDLRSRWSGNTGPMWCHTHDLPANHASAMP